MNPGIPYPVRPVVSALSLLFALSASSARAGDVIVDTTVGYSVCGNSVHGTPGYCGTYTDGTGSVRIGVYDRLSERMLDPVLVDPSALSNNSVRLTANGKVAPIGQDTFNYGQPDLNIIVGGYTSGLTGDYLFDSNRVTIEANADSSGSTVYGAHFVGGEAGDTTPSTANVTFTNNRVEVSGQVSYAIGAYIEYGFGDALIDNNVTVISGNARVTSDVAGGRADPYKTNANKAIITNNEVFVSGNAEVRGNISGGEALTTLSAGRFSETPEVKGNLVDISGDARIQGSSSASIRGGASLNYGGSAMAEENGVSISGNASLAVTGSARDVYGGYALAVGNDSTAGAGKNRVDISTRGTVRGTIYGGRATAQEANPNFDESGGAASATENRIDLSGGAVTGSIYGGYANAFPRRTDIAVSATENRIDLSGGTVTGSIYGGRAATQGANSTATATENRLFISDGTVVTSGASAGIYGGYATATGANSTAIATHNTLDISGAPDLSQAKLIGGRTTAGNDGFTENRLILHDLGGADPTGILKIDALYSFETLYFGLPAILTQATGGDSFLKVAGNANLTNSAELDSVIGARSSAVAVDGLGTLSHFLPGEAFHLIEANTLTARPELARLSSDISQLDFDYNGAYATLNWKLTTAYAANRFTAFLQRLKVRGDLTPPGGDLAIRSVPAAVGEDVILEVDGALRVDRLTVDNGPGGGVIARIGQLDATELLVDNSAGDNNVPGDGVTVDIGQLDATDKDVSVTLVNTLAWDDSRPDDDKGIRIGKLSLGKGHDFTLDGAIGGYHVDAWEIHGPLTFHGPLDANDSSVSFYIPRDLPDGIAIVTVVNAGPGPDASFDDARMRVHLPGDAPPPEGSQRILVETVNGVGDFSLRESESGCEQGATLTVECEIGKSGNDKQVSVRFGKSSPNEASELLPKGPLANQELLVQGGDLVASRALAATLHESDPWRPRIFALASGVDVSHDRARIDLNSHGLVSGVATGIAREGGSATVAVFVEHGEGDFTGHVDTKDEGRIKGKGHVRYSGGGLLARLERDDGAYLGGSLRGGVTRTRYTSAVPGRYETRGGYLGAHLGVGRLWALSETEGFDTYAQILYTRQNQDKDTLPSGEEIAFKATDSRRIKIGARAIHRGLGDKGMTGFLGLAYEREFSGKVRIQINEEHEISSSIKGGSAVLEIGLSGRPTKSHPLYFDFGIQGHAGKREGITGHVRVNYFF